MTKREIAKYFSKYTGFVASQINVLDFCNDFECKPYDIETIVFVSLDDSFIIQFKKYFKHAFVNLPKRNIEMYLGTKGVFYYG